MENRNREERLTPKQYRFIAFLYLILSLCFIGSIFSILVSSKGFNKFSSDSQIAKTVGFQDNTMAFYGLPYSVTGPTWDPAKSKWKWIFSPDYSSVFGTDNLYGCAVIYQGPPAQSGLESDPDISIGSGQVPGPYTIWLNPVGSKPSPPWVDLYAYVEGPNDRWDSLEPHLESPCVKVKISGGFTLVDGHWKLTVTSEVQGDPVGDVEYGWVNDYGAPSSGGGDTPGVVFDIGEGETGTIHVRCNIDAGESCSSFDEKDFVIPGSSDEPVPHGYYCNGTGCFKVDGTNDTLVDITGCTGPEETFEACKASCNTDGPQCPEGWMYIEIPLGGFYCQWVGPGSQPPGDPPSPECPDGYVFEDGMCVADSSSASLPSESSDTDPEESSTGEGSSLSSDTDPELSSTGEGSSLSSDTDPEESSSNEGTSSSSDTDPEESSTGEGSSESSDTSPGVSSTAAGTSSASVDESDPVEEFLGELGFEEVDTDSFKVILPTFPEGVTSATLQHRIADSSTWITTDVDAESNGIYLYTEAVPNTKYHWRLVLVGTFGTYTLLAYVETDQINFADAPLAPPTPTVVKDCEDKTLTVNVGAWNHTSGRDTESIEVSRSSNGGASWITIDTLSDDEEGDLVVDSDVESFTNYIYRTRGCNSNGCGPWSTSSVPKNLISTTSSGAWTSPGLDAELVGKVAFLYNFTDTTDVTSDHKVYINRKLVSSSPVKIAGTMKTGTMKIVLDTRKFIQEEVHISAEWVGSDGCLRRIENDVIFNNVRNYGTMYRDIKLGQQVSSGEEYHRVFPSLWLSPLDPSQYSRFWGQAAILTDISKSPADEDTQQADEDFDKLQPVLLTEQKSWPAMGNIENGRIIGTDNGVTITAPGRNLILRIRQESKVIVKPYETESESIKKIRRVEEGKHIVFSTNPDKVWYYTVDGLDLVVDITDKYELSNVRDVSVRGDKLYFIYGTRLYAHDLDSTAEEGNLIILVEFSQVRNPRFLETVENKLFVISTNSTLVEDKTMGSVLVGDQYSIAWKIDDYATLTWSNEHSLFIACGKKLYQSLGGTQEPVLISPVFSHSIASITEMGVGLTNGDVWVLTDSVWNKISGELPETSCTALTLWKGTYESLKYTSGSVGNDIYEQDENGSWMSRFELSPPETYDIPDQITEMDRFYIPGEEVEGEETPLDIERLLIGTGNQGLLYDLSVSRLSERAGAFEFTSIDDVIGVGQIRPIPVEEEES